MKVRLSGAARAYLLHEASYLTERSSSAGAAFLRDIRSARQRIGTVVYDKARELEDKGSREQALSLYEQAIALRGDAGPGWNNRMQALRKTLGDEHYQKGVRLYPTDASQAIKEWETSLRYDPHNSKAAARLNDARQTERKR